MPGGVRRSVPGLLPAGCLLAACLLAGCGTGQVAGSSGAPTAPPSSPSPSTAPSTPSTSSTPSTPAVPSTSSSAPPSQQPAPGTVPPPWLGTRVLPRTADGFGEVRPTPAVMRVRRWNTPDTIAPLPGTGFTARVASPAPASVIARSTWRPGCPVGKEDLAWVRMTYWGFDGARHSGEMLVNRSVADDVVGVFRGLYRARFPIESMGITTKADQDAPPTGDGNVTGSFDCRPVRGSTEFSQHAYGLAVDLDPFQNPYHRGDQVLPELASSYLDRGWVRPGMITPDGPVVRAFAAIGWGWGGAWSSLKDFQHFSQNDR